VNRWLFNLLAATSLALTIGFAALWIHSAWWDDYVRYYTRGADEYAEVESVRGQLILSWWTVSSRKHLPYPPAGLSHHAMELSQAPNSGIRPSGRFPGVGTVRMSRSMIMQGGATLVSRARAVYLPIAYPIILFAAIGTGMLLPAHRRRRRRRQTGCCVVCGYDLRATPERCPECGTTAIAR
jgi:hypothetical protein